MAIRRRSVTALLAVLATGLQLAFFAASPAAALTQSISIRPTSGSATQRITVTFVGESCGYGIPPAEGLWDAQPFIVFGPTPPSCKYVFTTTPQEGHRGPGTHHICAGVGADTTYYSCATYTILAPKPKATAKPTLKAAPAPTASPVPSPTGSVTATPTAIALETATPTPAPAPPTDPNASPLPFVTGAGGAVPDLTLVWIGGAIFLGLLVGVIIAAVRRARVLPPPR